jgi:hypothetical protein
METVETAQACMWSHLFATPWRSVNVCGRGGKDLQILQDVGAKYERKWLTHTAAVFITRKWAEGSRWRQEGDVQAHAARGDTKTPFSDRNGVKSAATSDRAKLLLVWADCESTPWTLLFNERSYDSIVTQNVYGRTGGCRLFNYAVSTADFNLPRVVLEDDQLRRTRKH